MWRRCWKPPMSASPRACDTAAARVANPGLVVADLSWFGGTGPYAAFRGSDMVCRALAGMVQLIGPAEGPPLVAAESPVGNYRRGHRVHRGRWRRWLSREAGDSGRHLDDQRFRVMHRLCGIADFRRLGARLWPGPGRHQSCSGRLIRWASIQRKTAGSACRWSRRCNGRAFA